MKIKKGPLFKRISKARNFLGLGEESWKELKEGKSIDLEPIKELVQKGYIVEIKKEKDKDK